MSSFPYFAERRPMDETARRAAPGRFVTLPAGVTHYELAEPPAPSAAAPVVLIHGLSVPMFIWDPVYAALAPYYRLLRYDLFGRGFSDRPAATYDVDFFVAQLHDLIAALALPVPVHLVGLSLGGAIAVHMADQHPDLVAKLSLLDPAGMPFPTPWPARIIRWPLLGELLMGLFGRGSLLKAMRADLLDPVLLDAYRDRYLAQMDYHGFMAALLATLRSGVVHNGAAAFARVGQQTRRIQIIWGEGDQTVPFATHPQVLAALPGAEFEPIAEAGHVPFFEQPAAVIALLDRFLRR